MKLVELLKAVRRDYNPKSFLGRELSKAIKHLDIGECEIDKNVLYVSNHHPWRCDRHFVSWATYTTETPTKCPVAQLLEIPDEH